MTTTLDLTPAEGELDQNEEVLRHRKELLTRGRDRVKVAEEEWQFVVGTQTTMAMSSIKTMVVVEDKDKDKDAAHQVEELMQDPEPQDPEVAKENETNKMQGRAGTNRAPHQPIDEEQLAPDIMMNKTSRIHMAMNTTLIRQVEELATRINAEAVMVDRGMADLVPALLVLEAANRERTKRRRAETSSTTSMK